MNFVNGRCYNIILKNGMSFNGVVVVEDGEIMFFGVKDMFDIDPSFVRNYREIPIKDVLNEVRNRKESLWNEEYYLDNSVLGNIYYG